MIYFLSLMLCLEVWRERRVEGSKGKKSNGEESRGEWLSSALFGCFLREEGEGFREVWRDFNYF